MVKDKLPHGNKYSDYLINKGKEYKERREQMIKQKEDHECDGLSFKP